MPTPTADEIRDAAAQNAADGVATHTSDGESTTAMDPLKQMDVADRVAARASVANGRGAWAGVRQARAITGGPAPQP